MSKWECVYVPVAIWADFLAEVVDHFEYGDPISTAVYADGRRVEFDSTVTDEMRADARQQRIVEMERTGCLVTSVRFKVTVRRADWSGAISGWTE